MRGGRAARLGALLAALLLPAAGAAVPPGRWTVADVRLVDAPPPAPGVAERLAAIRRRIQEALVYPPDARFRGLEGVAVLQFQIDAEGRAAELHTARSSGHWVLDRAAARAVRDAAPLPYVWGRLEVPVHFELHAGR